MGNYTIFLQFENPRRGRQARNLSENDPKILDLKSSSEQIIFRKLSLGAPEKCSNCRVTSLSVPFPILRYFPPTGCIYKSRCFDSDFFLEVFFSVEEGGERPDFGWLSIRATLFSFVHTMHRIALATTRKPYRILSFYEPANPVF